MQNSQQDALEVELIRSLFEAVSPVIIMSVGFVAAGGLMAWETRDPILALLLVAGAVTSIVRLIIMTSDRPEALRGELTIERARFLQRRFTYSYFGFASVLGMFGCQALQLPFPKVHMLMICMVVGYAAGVAANIFLRPRIALPSMLVAVVPALTAALAQPDVVYWATSMLASAFLAGGINSVRARYARAAKSISRRLAFSTLARQDGLTALPNRLALREWFAERVTDAAKPGMIAVHFLDLNGFKPVNDRFGHPTGDALLVAVSERIVRTIRPVDTAARLGGDEFAVLQCDIANADEAALMAKRLVSAIGAPYRIDQHTIEISTAVGYIVAEHGAEDLECLLSLADEALYASKRTGKGVTRWDPGLVDPERAAA
ncbi:MAG TPA: GGDEF domain-containing protein [Novosphingobium sp.]